MKIIEDVRAKGREISLVVEEVGKILRTRNTEYDVMASLAACVKRA